MAVRDTHLPMEPGDHDLPPEVARMLDFAQRWAPFGGGDPEDIFLSFGVRSRVYFVRLQQILLKHPAVVPDPTLRAHLIAVCADRLADPDPLGGPSAQAFFT